MEHQQKGMARKWERYYRETRNVVGWALILFGFTFTMCLSYLWPQIYNPSVFNSRLSYHLIMDIEDFWSCNLDYHNFVIDEPTTEQAMVQFFVFNVSNAPEVVQRGYKPYITEIGPYAYTKRTYKYEVLFNHIDPTLVSFKEYTILDAVSAGDPEACTRNYHRMGRSEVASLNPCLEGVCDCRDTEERMTIVNPLFLKIVWQESAHSILAYFSVDVYATIKDLYENEFVNSTRAHLASYAIGEIYQFREQMQTYVILETMMRNISEDLSYNWTAVGDLWEGPADYLKQCGLEDYELGTTLSWLGALCPISADDFIATDRAHLLSLAKNDHSEGHEINESHVPHARFLFQDNTTEYSPLNQQVGFAGYLGIAWALADWEGAKYLEFNEPTGHSMFNFSESATMISRRTIALATDAFGTDYTEAQYLGSRVLVKNVAMYVAKLHNEIFSFGSTASPYRQLTYTEFANSSEAVICNVHGMPCIWQYGYLLEHGNADFVLDHDLVHEFVSVERKLNTNPNNLAYLGNSAPWYNTWLYHYEVLGQGKTDVCYDLEFTYNDANVIQPAGVNAIVRKVDSTNVTYLQQVYTGLSDEEKQIMMNIASNMSDLLYGYYPTLTDFHDYYVIRYINKYVDAGVSHTFSEGNWKEIGWSQWGGGFITYLLAEVRTVYQVERDGMWHWGAEDFWDALMEYGSWCIKTGFPQAYIYDPYEARDLLIALADRGTDGVAFRQHVAYAGTTFIGDGVAENYVNEVGDVGEYAFVSEANRGDFSCTGTYAAACATLDTFFTSSAQNAYTVDALFQACKARFQKQDPYVSDLEKCQRFETSMTSPQQGIQVSETDVYGNLHPYTKSKGNVLYEMLYSLTMDLKIKSGLWCPNFDGCPYAWGGLFTSVKVRQLLFEGFTEPSVLRYLNMRYESDDVSFSCVENSVGECGKEILRCNEAGVYINLPGGESKVLSYALNRKDEYFSPYIKIVRGTNEMLYDAHINATVQARAAEVASSAPGSIITIRNPFWAAYPAWDSSDVDFQKFHQCQKRTYFGMPNLFASCRDMLNTGREELVEARNQIEFYGNDTLYYFDTRTTVDRISGETLQFDGSMNVNGSRYAQHPMSLWDGFQTYNYTYQGRVTGEDYEGLDGPRLFFKEHSISLKLNQEMFIYEWQKNILLAMPITDDFDIRNFTREKAVPTRRFQEWSESWAPLVGLGRPFDSYGMEYIIPADMASLEKLSGFPLFVGTPHAYGNELWGGTEYGHVQGYEPSISEHRTFVDYDPITGKNIRQAIRQQVNLRVEKGPLYPNVFGSQDRCIAPTKAFSANTGYGCFAYVPLLWIDDSRVMSNNEFYRIHNHYYMRPGRAYYLEMIGLIVGSVFMFVGLNMVAAEYYHKRNFYRRVYVD